MKSAYVVGIDQLGTVGLRLYSQEKVFVRNIIKIVGIDQISTVVLRLFDDVVDGLDLVSATSEVTRSVRWDRGF